MNIVMTVSTMWGYALPMVVRAVPAVSDPKKSRITWNSVEEPSSLKTYTPALEPNPMFISISPIAGAIPILMPAGIAL